MMTAQLTTKADMAEMLAELRTEIVQTRESLRAEMIQLGSDLKEKLSVCQNRLIMWVIGTNIVVVVLILAVIKLGQ
jgi:hypothetical protein